MSVDRILYSGTLKKYPVNRINNRCRPTLILLWWNKRTSLSLSFASILGNKNALLIICCIQLPEHYPLNGSR